MPGAHSSCPSCARMGVPDGGQDVSQRILSNTFGTAPRSGHALAPPSRLEGYCPTVSGNYGIDKVTVVQRLPVLRWAGVIPRGSSRSSNPV